MDIKAWQYQIELIQMENNSVKDITGLVVLFIKEMNNFGLIMSNKNKYKIEQNIPVTIHLNISFY